MGKPVTGIGRGGWRPGGGRPKGSRNKRTKAIVEALEAERQELPLPRILRRINDASLPENYRDQLAIAVMSYVHPKLVTQAVLTAPAPAPTAEGAKGVEDPLGWLLCQLDRMADRLRPDETCGTEPAADQTVH